MITIGVEIFIEAMICAVVVGMMCVMIGVVTAVVAIIFHAHIYHDDSDDCKQDSRRRK